MKMYKLQNRHSCDILQFSIYFIVKGMNIDCVLFFLNKKLH